jgi:hypothetical protein
MFSEERREAEERYQKADAEAGVLVPTAKRERVPPHPPHPLAVPLLLTKKKKVPTKSVCAGRQGKTSEGEKERRREGERVQRQPS